MTVSAIGAIGGNAMGSLPGLGGASAIGAASAGDMAGSLGSTDAVIQLLELINAASLSPGSKVAISDAAMGVLQGDASSNASLGELSQALIVALMLQLLKV